MLHILLSKSGNWNKSKNSNEERIDFLYYKTNGITSLKKCVDGDHSFIAQMFEEKMNSLLKSTKERQPSKKRINPFGGGISRFLSIKHTFLKKKLCHKKNF